MTSGVSRARVRSRRPWRMISWPAANPMRCVKPSMATVSPSRTRSATASRMVATLEAPTPWIIPARRPAMSADDLDLEQRAGTGFVSCHYGDRFTEDPQRCHHLILRDGQGRRHPDAGLAAFEDEQAAFEAGPLDLLGVHRRIELDAEHQALAADVEDETVELFHERRKRDHRLLAARGCVVDQASLEQFDRRESCGTCDRVSPVCRAMRAGPPGLQQLGLGDHRAEGHA